METIFEDGVMVNAIELNDLYYYKPGYYVSETGNIYKKLARNNGYSLQTKKEHPGGYMTSINIIRITDGVEIKLPNRTYIKYLVAFYFKLPNPNNYEFINFIDNNLLNTNLTNLEWVITDIAKKNKNSKISKSTTGKLKSDMGSTVRTSSNLSEEELTLINNFNNVTIDLIEEKLDVSDVIPMDKDKYYKENHYISPKGKIFKQTNNNWIEIKLNKDIRRNTIYTSIDFYEKVNDNLQIMQISSNRHLLHYILAYYFVTNNDPINKTCIIFKDNDKTNLNINNLEWGTLNDQLKNTNSIRRELINTHESIYDDDDDSDYINIGIIGNYDFSNYYINSNNEIKNTNNKVLTTVVNSDGYVSITLVDQNTNYPKCIKLHRLICAIYKNFDLDSKLQIDHIDKNRGNNNIDNLDIVTCKENNIRRISIGFYKIDKDTNEIVEFIRNIKDHFADNEIKQIKYSIPINRVVYGFKWRYEKDDGIYYSIVNNIIIDVDNYTQLISNSDKLIKMNTDNNWGCSELVTFTGKFKDIQTWNCKNYDINYKMSIDNKKIRPCKVCDTNSKDDIKFNINIYIYSKDNTFIESWKSVNELLDNHIVYSNYEAKVKNAFKQSLKKNLLGQSATCDNKKWSFFPPVNNLLNPNESQLDYYTIKRLQHPNIGLLK